MSHHPKREMRYYLVRTPEHRGDRLTEGIQRSNKRDAIATAKAEARIFWNVTPKRDRRVSVYVMDPGKRASLLFQCHWSRTEKRIVSEIL